MPSLLALILAVPAPLHESAFRLDQPAEVVATVTAGCQGCDWGVRGREAAVL
jgi:hypothetical protein